MNVATLGDVIRRFRQARNMSQGALSRAAKVDRQTISNIETGRTNSLRTEQFRGIAEAMGMDAEALQRATLNSEDELLTLDKTLSATVRKYAKLAGAEPLAWLAGIVAKATEDDCPYTKTNGGAKQSPRPPAPAASAAGQRARS